ncbi:MAG: lytic murein transglycosylase [Patescibacteria group bacterium]|nr:lytic murein transglycosylase [Patescibacteria group bacterium]
MKARLFFVGALTIGAFLFHQLAFADTATSTDDVASRRAQLQQELDQLNSQIAAQQQVLEQAQNQGSSLQRDIAVLNAQIQKDELSIKARDLKIQSLTGDIGQKNDTIVSLDSKLGREQQSLADILRKTRALDEYTVAEVVLSSESVSTFFEDLDSFASIKGALQQSFTDIGNTKTETAQEKTDLEDKRANEQELRQQQVIQEKQVQANKAQQQTLLTAVKNQASKYQSAIQANQKVVASIEAELFALRDTAAIPFGQALSYADLASQKTGVRSAFILGILKQESDLGANIGSCYVTDISTGAGIGKNSGTPFASVMKSPRDTLPFQAITGALGISWATAPVSCPQGGGYGGAMGPSQFIPSTWQLYAGRLASALGVSTANPWNAKDAIMATAMYLADIGGSGGNYTAERNAACKYYSGRSCDNRTPANQFYGDSVMDNAGYFQNQIDIVKG